MLAPDQTSPPMVKSEYLNLQGSQEYSAAGTVKEEIMRSDMHPSIAALNASTQRDSDFVSFWSPPKKRKVVDFAAHGHHRQGDDHHHETSRGGQYLGSPLKLMGAADSALTTEACEESDLTAEQHMADLDSPKSSTEDIDSAAGAPPCLAAPSTPQAARQCPAVKGTNDDATVLWESSELQQSRLVLQSRLQQGGTGTRSASEDTSLHPEHHDSRYFISYLLPPTGIRPDFDAPAEPTESTAVQAASDLGNTGCDEWLHLRLSSSTRSQHYPPAQQFAALRSTAGITDRDRQALEEQGPAGSQRQPGVSKPLLDLFKARDSCDDSTELDRSEGSPGSDDDAAPVGTARRRGHGESGWSIAKGFQVWSKPESSVTSHAPSPAVRPLYSHPEPLGLPGRDYTLGTANSGNKLSHFSLLESGRDLRDHQQNVHGNGSNFADIMSAPSPTFQQVGRVDLNAHLPASALKIPFPDRASHPDSSSTSSSLQWNPVPPRMILQPVKLQQTETTSVNAWRDQTHDTPKKAEQSIGFQNWKRPGTSTGPQNQYPNVEVPQTGDAAEAWRKLVQWVGNKGQPFTTPSQSRTAPVPVLLNSCMSSGAGDRSGLDHVEAPNRAIDRLQGHGHEALIMGDHFPTSEHSKDRSSERLLAASTLGSGSKPRRRRRHGGPNAGLWFTLQASESQAGASDRLQQIPTAYIRVKDEQLTISAVKKYLVNKLGLTSENEVEITCKGQPVVSSLPLRQVRDGIWQAPNTTIAAARKVQDPSLAIAALQSEGKAWKSADGSVACVQDVVLVLTYSRGHPPGTP